MLGLGRERLRLATFLPDDVEPLKAFLADFVANIKAIGKSPIICPAHEEDLPRKSLSESGLELLDMAPRHHRRDHSENH